MRHLIRPSFLNRLAGWLAAALLLGAGAAQAAYVITEVARAGADSTSLFDVNNSGTMVGYATTGSGLATDSRGFITTDGVTFTDLAGPAGAVASFALGISDAGTVVGSYNESKSLDADGNLVFSASRGFLYSGGSYTLFDVAGAIETYLRGISADGRYISGYYVTATQAAVGFVYDRSTSTLTSIGAPDSQFTIMQGINGSGVVVGSDIQSGGSRPGLIYDIGTATLSEASIAGVQRTALRSIEDDGTLAGWYRDAAGATHGFFGSLTSFEQIDFAGATDTFVEGSNAAGVLVGSALVGDQFHAFVARQTPVPEPAGLALVLVAGAAAGVATRRRPRA